MTTALIAIATTAIATTSNVMSACAPIVRMPRHTPWSAVAPITARSRFAPSTNRFSSRTVTSRGSKTADMSPHEEHERERAEQAARQQQGGDVRHPEPCHRRLDHADRDRDDDEPAEKREP